MLGNGIPLERAPFDHPIGNIMVQMLYKAKMVENYNTKMVDKAKMVENYNTKMVDDAKMLDGAIASSLFPKIII
jgi:hypothetical protein